jgi:hypothetical protein
MTSSADGGRRRRLLEHEVAMKVALERLRELLTRLERDGLDEAAADLGQALLRLEDAFVAVSYERTSLEIGQDA